MMCFTATKLLDLNCRRHTTQGTQFFIALPLIPFEICCDCSGNHCAELTTFTSYPDSHTSSPACWLSRFTKMLPGAHVFSHQHQYNPQGEPAWMHQSHHQHAQQAAAAAASAAQQQHYNRIAASHNAAGPSISSAHGQDTSLMENVTEENRRTLAFIADLLNEDTREAALLELSKKREQVPELALILWHSFGMFNNGCICS